KCARRRSIRLRHLRATGSSERNDAKRSTGEEVSGEDWSFCSDMCRRKTVTQALMHRHQLSESRGFGCRTRDYFISLFPTLYRLFSDRRNTASLRHLKRPRIRHSHGAIRTKIVETLAAGTVLFLDNTRLIFALTYRNNQTTWINLI